jgi:hypothetical protein
MMMVGGKACRAAGDKNIVHEATLHPRSISSLVRALFERKKRASHFSERMKENGAPPILAGSKFIPMEI